MKPISGTDDARDRHLDEFFAAFWFTGLDQTRSKRPGNDGQLRIGIGKMSKTRRSFECAGLSQDCEGVGNGVAVVGNIGGLGVFERQSECEGLFGILECVCVALVEE
ncbi:MAG: hypothetical protein R2710_22575 [Acidimicrobiales bacterium]